MGSAFDRTTTWSSMYPRSEHPDATLPSWESRRSLAMVVPMGSPTSVGEAFVHRPQSDLGPCGQTQLRENASNVGLDGPFAKHQRRGDLAIRLALRDLAHHLELPTGQAAEASRSHTPRLSPTAVRTRLAGGAGEPRAQRGVLDARLQRRAYGARGLPLCHVT